MVSSTLKRSVATVGVVAGLLAAAVPAGKTVGSLPTSRRVDVPALGTGRARGGSTMGVLRGLGQVIGALLAGVFGLLRGLFEGLGRLLRRLV